MDRGSVNRLIILLPEVLPPTPELHWWRTDGEAILDQGSDGRWLVQAEEEGTELIALTPAAAVRLAGVIPQGTTDQQARAVATASARDGSVADPSTVHTVGQLFGQGGEARVWTALVANESMLVWIEWLQALGCSPTAVLPSGAILIPQGDHWQQAHLGNEALLGGFGQVVAHEPEIATLLVGDQPVEELTASDVQRRLVQLAIGLPLNLRVGRFARRRVFVLDWARVRELVALAMLVPLLGLVMALIVIVRLNSHSAELERETADLATVYLGRPVAASAAASELDLRAQQTPGASGSPFPTMAALYRYLESGSGVTSTAMAWRRDGTLVTTLAATRTDDLNRVLIGLQGSGFKITAVPRQAPDGRAMADVTIRSSQ